MSPILNEDYEQHNYSDDEEEEEDDDEGLKEDMEALSRACMIAAPTDAGEIHSEDPLLAAGDTVVAVAVDSESDSDSDDELSDIEYLKRVQSLYKPSVTPLPMTTTTKMKNMNTASDSDDDDEDDMETARAILKRFSNYKEGTLEGGMEALTKGDQALSQGCEGDIANSSISHKSDAGGESCLDSQYHDTNNLVIGDIKMQRGNFVDSYGADAGGESCPESQYPDTTNLETGDLKMQDGDSVYSYEPDAGGESYPVPQYPDAIHSVIGDIDLQLSNFVDINEPDAGESSNLPPKRSSFPRAVHSLVDAIKKNRAFQKFLRSKLIVLEAKIEENKQIRDKVKILRDFQISCSRRTGSALSLKKDPRVQLISTRKTPAPNNSKSHSKKLSPMCYGPNENSRVANYKMVLERFPLSIDRKKWSNVEKENLSRGIKQQFQEMVLQISVDRVSSESSSGDANDMDSIIASVKDLEFTPEKIREFLPKVNWDRLASMYVTGRTGAECESRWLNCEDPLINHGPWTSEEDRSLMIIVQEKGIRNWFNIAVSLGTNRTPFQCLARYQRSLNPSMLNSEWTEDEDAQLSAAVAFFGKSDWQSVASVLERRTGTQCSNRWKKSLCPVRKGSFTPEEDKRLTVAVMLFGRKWNQIAKYVPGRIQSQCRDRYLNSLDPSLKWGGWTEEEDSRLAAAIAKHGFCWSKVAEDMPPRTDSQCRKRWKVLCPDQVPLLQEARKRQKSLIASNFVDRESERPNLTLNDFLPIQMLALSSDAGTVNLHRKQNRKSSNVSKKTRSQKDTEEARDCPEEVQDITVHTHKVRTQRRGVPFNAWSNIPKKKRSKRHAKKARILPKEMEDIPCRDKVKTSTENLESHDWDMTLAYFIHTKSKKRQPKCTKSVSKDSFSSRTIVVSKQVENKIPFGEHDGGTTDLFMQQNVVSQGQVSKPEDGDAVRKPEDANNLTGGDYDDMTLACFVGNKSKKRSQAAKGCTSSSSKPTIIADGCGSSLSKPVEKENVLNGGVADPTNINEEEDDLLSSFLLNKTKRQGKQPNIHKVAVPYHAREIKWFGPINLFWSMCYDKAMTLFLAYAKDFAELSNSKDQESNIPPEKCFKLPYKIENDKVEKYSITQSSNKQENLTKAQKYALCNMKWALYWFVGNTNFQPLSAMVSSHAEVSVVGSLYSKRGGIEAMAESRN